MSFKIVLHTPPFTTYSPGSTLGGHVELETEGEFAIESVVIEFVGFCKSRIKVRHGGGVGMNANGMGGGGSSTGINQSKGLYFAQQVNLTKDLVQPQWSVGCYHYRWPFNLRIPKLAEQVSHQTISSENLDTFTSKVTWRGSSDCRPHPLPDSFQYEESFARLASGICAAVGANVTYKIHATLKGLEDSYVPLSGDKDTEFYVVVRSQRPLAPPTGSAGLQTRECDRIVKSPRLLPERAGAQLSFRERTQSIFCRSRIPRIMLKLSISLPDQIFIDSPRSDTISFLLSVVRVAVRSASPASRKDEQFDNQIPTPSVTLKRFMAMLVAHTRVRTIESEIAGRESEHSATATKIIVFYDATMKDLEGEESFDVPTTGETFDLGQELGIRMAKIVMHPETHAASFRLVPDFETYNISRDYSVRWKLQLSVCGEEINWDVDDETVKVRLIAGNGKTHEDMM